MSRQWKAGRYLLYLVYLDSVFLLSMIACIIATRAPDNSSTDYLSPNDHGKARSGAKAEWDKKDRVQVLIAVKQSREKERLGADFITQKAWFGN
jgi:hypothetical protein